MRQFQNVGIFTVLRKKTPQNTRFPYRKKIVLGPEGRTFESCRPDFSKPRG
ncbi:hypothetical protein RSSM_06090 [Rhodopirellula sallentina SM41]|uniref:Uncharacterized protein n=1 Tax=Rhodopirellula sallentina SM41 TaxID=1263870 RepID=M5TTE7_9BACT|nr:hypothetical protein RSSM_06090 [Rhodopirellula sallentina SM41]